MATRKPGHLVDWDIEFNRPVVDGKIVNPFTGQIQQAGKNGLRSGPPCVAFKLFNINSDVNIGILMKDLPVSLEKLYVGIAKNVEQGIYSLVSVNASAYSFIVICAIRVSAEEFQRAWNSMYEHSDEEWHAYLEGKQMKPSTNPSS